MGFFSKLFGNDSIPTIILDDFKKEFIYFYNSFLNFNKCLDSVSWKTYGITISISKKDIIFYFINQFNQTLVENFYYTNVSAEGLIEIADEDMRKYKFSPKITSNDIDEFKQFVRKFKLIRPLDPTDKTDVSYMFGYDIDGRTNASEIESWLIGYMRQINPNAKVTCETNSGDRDIHIDF